MKWLRTLVIFDRGGVVYSPDWAQIHDSYVRSIQRIDFPEGASTLTLRCKEREWTGVKWKWHRNGVGYLRQRFLHHMVVDEGWRPEVGVGLGRDRIPPQLMLYPGFLPHQEEITSEFGDFDFVTTAPNGMHVAIEWETGNISSSHRSMNKLAIALGTGKIHAGVLIVPSRNLYEHLTDRIGNIGELSGYLSMWQNLGNQIQIGLLAISIVEHDFLTTDPGFPYLKVGNDGNAEKE
jgi:hypothetical protein